MPKGRSGRKPNKQLHPQTQQQTAHQLTKKAKKSKFLNDQRYYLESTPDNKTFNDVFTYFAQASRRLVVIE